MGERSVRRICEPANAVVVCLFTSQTHHLLEHLHLPDWAYRQIPCEGDPMRLGFRAQEFMAKQLGVFDWYCFMEDDLVIEDALFFQKLRWWQQLVGPEFLLQPNRFELGLIEPKPHKLYVDAPMGRAQRFWADEHRPVIEGSVMGVKLRFERAINPHSGCYFLSATQMEMLSNSAGFGEPDERFVGPLESAASLAIMKRFRVYKSVAPHMHFFEIRHFAARFIHQLSIQLPPP